MIASFLLSSSLVPVLSVWLLAKHRSRDADARADDWVERLRNRLARVLQRLAPARGAARRGLRAGDGGDRRGGRPDARARDLPAGGANQFQLRFRAPPARSSSPPSGWPTTCSTRSTARPARTTWTSRSGTSACSPRRIRSTRSFSGPAGRTKACCRSRSSRRRGCGSATSKSVRAAVPRPVSGGAVLVRAGRHREPDHELRRADAGRGGDHGTRFRREPNVRDEGAGRARPDSDASRSAVRPGARLPGDSGGREPPAGRAARA